jgi:hypothetical protein
VLARNRAEWGDPFAVGALEANLAKLMAAGANPPPRGFLHYYAVELRELFAEGSPVAFGAVRWAAAWKRHAPQLVPVLRRAKGLAWFKNEHDEKPAAILTDLPADEVARLGEELTKRRDGQLILGRAVSAEEAARWSPRDYARAVRDTFHLLAPLYRLR